MGKRLHAQGSGGRISRAAVVKVVGITAILGLLAFIWSVPPAGAATPTCSGMPATIVGTPGPDDITGTPGDDVIVGLGGDDTISGQGGNDTICGNDGADSLIGEEGNDLLHGL